VLNLQTTKALGIHQSDLIIRTAIIAGIADIRRNPWLLDYCFASISQDTLTKDVYGAKSAEQAKKYFLSSNIPVFMDTRVDSAKLPAISIHLQSSDEAENTTADINYDVSEATEAPWTPLAGPFAPSAYVASTGKMTIPAASIGDLVLAPGMFVIDSVGLAHEIQDVLDDGTVLVQPGTTSDFRRSYIKGSQPRLITSLESVTFKETYTLGVHVQGEASYLTYLHSILVFILLRYKETLLEARGFERSVISSSDVRPDTSTEKELAWVRYMSITGYVKQIWPKAVSERIQSTVTQPTMGFAGTQGPGVTDAGKSGTDDDSWLADQDALAAGFLTR